MSSQRDAVARAMSQWRADGRDVVLATVVSTSDSAPRGLGAQLAVTVDDLWVGGLSGGCAEVAVLDQARELLAAGDAAARRAVLLSLTKDGFGAIGPVCGATLGVLVERVDDGLATQLASALELHRAGLWVHAVRNYAVAAGVVGAPGASGVVGDEVLGTMHRLASTTHGSDRASLVADGIEVGTPRRGAIGWSASDATAGAQLTWVVPPPPRVVVCGAGDIAGEVLGLAQGIGWRTVLVDPRGRFVDHTLAHVVPDEVVREWPQRALDGLAVDASTACVSLAHDEKLDLPFLTAALQTDAFYVGSVGSRSVQRARSADLEAAVGSARAMRHRGPAGLDLGGSDASEIALSIVAELVASWNGRTATPLVETRTAIRAQ